MLLFDQTKQKFFFDEKKLNLLDYRDLNNKFNTRNISKNYLFASDDKKKNYYIFKNFINKDIVIKLQNYFVNSNAKNSFINTKNGSSRLFFYLNSPFFYPNFIKSLITKCMDIKNMIYVHHDYYQNYCMINALNPNDFEAVTKNQLLHSWQSVYWYKNGCKFEKHIDHYGELACFLILSEKKTDYLEGGLEITYSDGTITKLDEKYNYGDLVFVDQSKVYHEVKKIMHNDNQIGRLQLYIPTIPPNYMKKELFYENYSHQPHFTNNKINLFYKIKTIAKSFFQKQQIHYSRVDSKLDNFTL